MKNWSNICRSFAADLAPVFHYYYLLSHSLLASFSIAKYVWWIMGHILNGKHIFQNSFSIRRRRRGQNSEASSTSTTLTPPENIISLTTSRATAVFPGEFFQWKYTYLLPYLLLTYTCKDFWEAISPPVKMAYVSHEFLAYCLSSISDPCPSIICASGQMTLLSGIKMPIEGI